MSTTLFHNNDFWILSKPPKTHTEEEVSGWAAVHRLDFETSGCLLYCRPELLNATRALFQSKNPDMIRKLYLCGASREVRSVGWGAPALVQGYVGGRYRNSKKTQFALDKHRLRGWHSVQEAEHTVRKLEPSEVAIYRHVFHGELYEVELISGARHQIRAYFANEGSALMHDPVYGEVGSATEASAEMRMELHAIKLEFEHPLKPGEWIRAEAPLK